MKNVGLNILILISQLVVYVIVHELGVQLAATLFDKSGSSLNWGITVKYSLFLFGLVAIGLAVVQSFVVNSKKELLILLVFNLTFCAFYFTDLKITPYRTILLMLSGVVGLSLPILVKRKVTAKKE